MLFYQKSCWIRLYFIIFIAFLLFHFLWLLLYLYYFLHVLIILFFICVFIVFIWLFHLFLHILYFFPHIDNFSFHVNRVHHFNLTHDFPIVNLPLNFRLDMKNKFLFGNISIWVSIKYFKYLLSNGIRNSFPLYFWQNLQSWQHFIFVFIQKNKYLFCIFCLWKKCNKFLYWWQIWESDRTFRNFLFVCFILVIR